jgi:hypothetical protein
MATTDKANRKELIDGCGTILKSSRLKGGYRLVKRKRAIGSTTKRKAGRPAKAKVETITEKVVMVAPATAKRKAGRPAKAKVVITETVSVPKKARGRKPSAIKTTMKPSVKMVTKKKATRGKRKKTAKA